MVDLALKHRSGDSCFHPVVQSARDIHRFSTKKDTCGYDKIPTPPRSQVPGLGLPLAEGHGRGRVVPAPARHGGADGHDGALSGAEPRRSVGDLGRVRSVWI